MRRPEIEDYVRSTLDVPRGDRLIVLFDEAPGDIERPSGLIIPQPQVTHDMIITGTVMKAGDGIHGVSEGTRVVCKRIMGSPIHLDGLDGCVLRLMDIEQVEATLDGREAEKDYDFWSEGLTLSGD